ncbi:hypothetical protein [Streptomyces zhihengii]|uniref:Uncharacterized protein n=1 Tax=Streptomyces zhihengii TaxID=1818004 RepID=A0ABS2ULF9_9ACTN|nr:hypothetical protein [Streptomyces zhihengii]MBM9618119.1 hypothetical protein [Streptomyces zhihengii]
MDNLALTRAHRLITVQLVASAAALGILAGYLLGGPFVAGFTGALAAAGSWAGSAYARRRALAAFREECAAAADDGYAEGLAQTVLIGIATYQAAVFPIEPGGVSDEEAAARRRVAYGISAYDGLPHQVRASAAAALEAIDHGLDPEPARQALRDLATTVYEQRGR